ncbi:MAG: lipase family protein [Bacteroidetes bacterium HLUCCA01]|nr:MAG: lipase family protein [Bacteroidetes bacterium HLUCCA01]
MLLTVLPYLLYAFIFWGGYRLLRRQVYARGGELPHMHPAAFRERYYEPVNKPEPTTPLQRLQNWISESEAAEFTNDRDETPAATLTDSSCRSTPQAGADMDHTAPPGIQHAPGGDRNPSLSAGTTPPGSVLPDNKLKKTADYPDKVLVCLGDSITHGRCSDDYVHRVRQDIPSGWEVVNAGINGDTAWNMLRRLDDVIACQPDTVTILAGTNDVNAAQSASMEASYRRSKAIPADVALDRQGYLNAMQAMLHRLRQETRARIAVYTIPMIGEVSSDPINQTVRHYNAGLMQLCSDFGITVLELHEAQQRIIQTMHAVDSEDGNPADKSTGASSAAGEGRLVSNNPADAKRPNLTDTVERDDPAQRNSIVHTRTSRFPQRKGYTSRRVEREIKIAPYRRFVLMQSWNQISDHYGYYTLIDGMHLNDRGGMAAAALLLKWMKRNRE